MFGYVNSNVKYYIFSQIFYKKNRVNVWQNTMSNSKKEKTLCCTLRMISFCDV